MTYFEYYHHQQTPHLPWALYSPFPFAFATQPEHTGEGNLHLKANTFDNNNNNNNKGKQLLWQKVSKEVGSIRELEHKKSVEHYDNVIEKREKYALPPMSDEERKVLKKHFEKDTKST